jgi:hypothetical protein
MMRLTEKQQMSIDFMQTVFTFLREREADSDRALTLTISVVVVLAAQIGLSKEALEGAFAYAIDNYDGIRGNLEDLE